MKEKLIQFMRGRYGMDELSRFLLIAAFGLILVANLAGSTILYLMGTAMIVFAYYRMFSKEIFRCQQQNRKFLKIRNRLVGTWRSRLDSFGQRKDYRFYSCPSCRQKVRIPKGKGKVEITCPRCAAKFPGKS